MTNKRHFYLSSLLLTLSFLLFGYVSMAPAVAATPDSGAGFTISPQFPANQNSQTTGYFDLTVAPKDTQEITVNVINTTDHARKLRVQPTDAWTGDNGLVNYTPNPKKRPETKTSFTKLTSRGVTVDLNAHEGKPVTFTTKVPAQGFSGQILGGIFVTDPAVTKTTGKQNFKINNRYAMIIGVLLHQANRAKVTPDLKLASVTGSQKNQRATILATLKNPRPVLFGKMTIHAKVTGQMRTTTTLKNYEVAPNSRFNAAIDLGERKLQPGRYHLDLTAKSGRHTWHFKRNFTVTKKAANQANEHIKVKQNWLWLWITLGVLAAGLLLFGGYWLGRRRQRK
ncbi:DUF916 and DUF3324 domain-containing protein [Furfurilactobacillus curtus]|uniref:Cell surface protein n=1 Tax=Furfurilactobacillus curtus TaxID=1746200 RepID=A0ABQ5JQM8_9LACO